MARTPGHRIECRIWAVLKVRPCTATELYVLKVGSYHGIRNALHRMAARDHLVSEVDTCLEGYPRRLWRMKTQPSTKGILMRDLDHAGNSMVEDLASKG